MAALQKSEFPKTKLIRKFQLKILYQLLRRNVDPYRMHSGNGAPIMIDVPVLLPRKDVCIRFSRPSFQPTIGLPVYLPPHHSNSSNLTMKACLLSKLIRLS